LLLTILRIEKRKQKPLLELKQGDIYWLQASNLLAEAGEVRVWGHSLDYYFQDHSYRCYYTVGFALLLTELVFWHWHALAVLPTFSPLKHCRLLSPIGRWPLPDSDFQKLVLSCS
jgi:hypothetical protein